MIQTDIAKTNGSATGTNGSASAGSTFRERTPAEVNLDNLIRRRLRVNDPNDASQIADALGKFYPGEVAKLGREAGGYPFALSTVPVTTQAPIYVRTDAEGIMQDIDENLDAVESSPFLRELKPEIRGWASGIRGAIRSGLRAATGGIDPQQRERVFASRRSLGDFARLVRFAGSLTPDAQSIYRKLARTLDDAASIMLVLLGDSLVNAGLVGNRFLLQAPTTDLQARRDAVILALRNLCGGAGTTSPDGWPRGVLAMRQVSVYLQQQGYADLQPLLEETYLASQLDELVHSSSADGGEGLRALAANAEPVLNGLRRLVLVCQGTAVPQSPELEGFRVALQHFLDPFDPGIVSNGYRLAFISRPPILLTRLTGLAMPDWGCQALIQLASIRYRIADEIEHFHEFDTGNDMRLGEQVLLDGCLQAFDKAIDLYALGVDPGADGPAEWRAASYGYLAHCVLLSLPLDARGEIAIRVLEQMRDALVYWDPRGPAVIPPPPANQLPLMVLIGAPNPAQQQIIGEELALETQAENRWFDTARSLSPDFRLWSRGINQSPLQAFINQARVMANAPVIPAGFNVPRDVPTLLEVVI